MDEGEDLSYEGTVRQNRLNLRPALAVHTDDSASISSTHDFSTSNRPMTPIALPQDDDEDDIGLEPPQAPFGQGLRAKASYESLNSNPTSRSQSSLDLRPSAAKDLRKPSASGSVGDGLRGFQFPLNKAAMASRPAPPLQRGNSAAPESTISPTRPGMQRMQSAMPDMQPSQTPSKPQRPQISVNLPPRPPMMRHASAAVMEGRAQAQAQAQVFAAVDETGGPLSPTRNLGVPGRPQIGLGVVIAPVGGHGVGMSRSRSGSRTDDQSVGLRDLMRVRYHHNLILIQ
jgi:protein-serine/threonine kinase